MTPSPNQTNLATLAGSLDVNLPITNLRLPNGRVIQIPTRALLGEDEPLPAVEPDLMEEGTTEVIPLIEEQLVIEKQIVETGRVRLTKTMGEYQQEFQEPLAMRTFDVERIPFHQPVDQMPAVRQEGATTIYPVVEEQLRLTKCLVLTEEVRVTLRETERLETQVVTLRREHLTVEREALSPSRST